MMWPQRSSKLGTYDRKWQNERWPFFPEDMDWTYFNTAPPDQWSDQDFVGGEALAFENMHPQKSRLESKLPRLRQRCFINQLVDLEKPDGDTRFIEVVTRLDTVWLFPHAERGVIFHRGVTEMADDEPRDIKHIFLVTENPDEPPKDINHYWDVLHKRLDRTVKIDTGPLADARQQIEEVSRNSRPSPRPTRMPWTGPRARRPYLSTRPRKCTIWACRGLSRGWPNSMMRKRNCWK